jgi:glycosyltransferase involved in cell wall biosynthesis
LGHRRILFVIGSLAIGGAERQLVTLAAALAHRGASIQVFTLEAGGPLQDELARAGVEVIDGGYDSRVRFALKLPLLVRAQWRLVRTLLRWHANVVHAFLPLAGLLAVNAGRLCRVSKVVVARRALGTHQERHPYWRWVDRFVSRMAHVVTANANAVAADAAIREGIPLTKIRVIPNGIEVSNFQLDDARRREIRSALRLDGHELAVVCTANLIPYKGHHDLLEAFARLAHERPASRLFLVGSDRGVGTSLAARAVELGVAANVVQLGHRDDIAALLGAMDLGVLASHEEGLSNAILEYLAAGLPVVATDVGGTAEILRDLPGCRLVAAHDPQGLAAALLALLDEAPDAARRLARRHAVTQRFSVDAMVERHLELYGFAPYQVAH